MRQPRLSRNIRQHLLKHDPFDVRDDAEIQWLVESVSSSDVNQFLAVRPREGGMKSSWASKLAEFAHMPCIVRNMTDNEAILSTSG